MNKRQLFIEYIKNYYKTNDIIPSKNTYRKLSNTPISCTTVCRFFGSWNNAIIACGLEPLQVNIPRIEKECLCCGVLTKNPKFCSRKCCAIITNSIQPKKTKKPRFCKQCNVLIFNKNRRYCEECRKPTNYTKEQIAYGKNNGANKYSRINEDARKVTKDWKQECKECKYNKHVEVCHIKSIRSYPDSALLSEINDPDNLILLCRNCHWEFDNNYL